MPRSLKKQFLPRANAMFNENLPHSSVEYRVFFGNATFVEDTFHSTSERKVL